jgi:hypothetical protein
MVGSINLEYSTKLAITYLCSFLTTMLDDLTCNDFHMLAYAASLADTDTNSVQQSDCEEFVKAMEKEIANHIDCKHWSIQYTCEKIQKMGYQGHVIMAI